MFTRRLNNHNKLTVRGVGYFSSFLHFDIFESTQSGTKSLRSLTKSATRLSKVRAGYYLTIPKLLQLQQYQYFNAIRVRHSVNRGGNCEFTYDSLRAVPDKIICAKFLPCWSKDHWLQVECAYPLQWRWDSLPAILVLSYSTMTTILEFQLHGLTHQNIVIREDCVCRSCGTQNVSTQW